MARDTQHYPADVCSAARGVGERFGMKRLAALLGISLSSMYGKTDPLDHASQLTVWDVMRITMLTRDTRIVEAISRSVGGAHYQLPDLTEVPDDALLNLLMEADIQRGRFSTDLRQAMQDQRINPAELKQLDTDLLDVISVYAELRARLASMATGA